MSAIDTQSPERPGDSRAWMRSNLTTQGFCLSDGECRELWLGVRFSTGLCLTLVVAALVLASPVMIFMLCGIGVVAGFASRHPVDLVWNHAVRHAVGGPPLPLNPRRRRHAFKLATVWLAAVGTLFLTGAALAATVLGGLLVAACALVTATNLCLPSEALAWWDRHRNHVEAVSA
jgi:hypothetical protein